MKNIVIYGAPAAGKGSICEKLVEKYKYNHISTGNLFRNLDDSTEFNRKIHETIAKGNLVDDETTSKLVQNHLETLDNNPIVLDGFPRNLNQAKILDTFFDNYIVINIEVSEMVALERALGRVTCSKCGKIYNKYSEAMKPLKEGICDVCGGDLVGRSDDNEESFKTRYNIYMNNVESLLNYYSEKNLLFIINSDQKSPNEIFEEIEKVIK